MFTNSAESRIFLFMIMTGVIYTAPFISFAADATLSFSPDQGAYDVGKTFTVNVMIDPDGQSVNVVEANVSFDNKKLSVSSVSKDGSVLSLWTTEPSFSNSDGTIKISGGSPSSFSKKSSVLKVVFKALSAGSANVSFSSGSALAADGKGTDVLSKKTGAIFTINEAGTQPVEKEQVDPTAEQEDPYPSDIPKAPEIKSSTHEDSEKWYSKNVASFSWDVESDITSVRLLISEEDSQTPNVVYTPPLNSREIKDMEDGEWYFYVQLRNSSGWGEVGKKKIMIDTVVPEDFEIKVLNDGVHSEQPKLFFETADSLSGIDHYDLSIGDIFAKTVYPNNLVDGAYKIPPQGGGDQLVTVKAYDKAGNVKEKKETLTLPLVEAVVVGEDEVIDDATAGASSFGIKDIIIIVFVFATGALTVVNIQRKSRFNKERAEILQRASDIVDKTGKVFSALREEFDDQVDDLDKRPQLTHEERELRDNLREALDISEELINTEVDNLRKTIKINN